MPPTFRGSYDALGTDMWVPLMRYATLRPRGLNVTSRGWGWLNATGRLHDNVSIEDARTELARLAAALDREFPNSNRSFRVRVVEALAVPEEMAGTLRRVLLFALLVVGFALAAACANVANAQLAGVVARQREIAVRLAVGASRARVVRQWLTESLVIAAAATALGLAVASWAQEALLDLRPPSADFQNLAPNLALDWRVLAFTACVGVIVAVLFGGLPALRAARIDVSGPLKEDGITSLGSRRRGLAQGTLVVLQVAVSLALMVSAGLLLRSLSAASRRRLWAWRKTSPTTASAKRHSRISMCRWRRSRPQ